MVDLIRAGVPGRGGVWADCGSGAGNFAWALAELIGRTGVIHTLDRDGGAVASQHTRIRRDPPGAQILPRQADITRPLDLPLLDGLLMANVLHFVRRQEATFGRLLGHLRPGGCVIVVEYEQSFPLPWVPFPVPLRRFLALAETGALLDGRQVGLRRSPSSGRPMYAAAASKPR